MSRREKDGLKKYCKECAAIQTKRYREKHKDAINERKRTAYAQSKEHADEKTQRELKEGFKVCTRCGVQKPITEFGMRGNGGFYSQCKKCVCEITAEYTKQNYEKVIQRKRNYHKTHKAEIDAYNRQYYLEHKDDVKQRVRDWEVAHPEQTRERSVIGLHDRRFRKVGLKSSFTRGDWKDCKAFFSEDGVVKCAYCGKPLKRATIDHVVPIDSGGENTKNNIVPACLKCNSGKINHSLEEWYRKQSFYSEERESKIKAYLNQ